MQNLVGNTTLNSSKKKAFEMTKAFSFSGSDMLRTRPRSPRLSHGLAILVQMMFALARQGSPRCVLTLRSSSMNMFTTKSDALDRIQNFWRVFASVDLLS